MMCFNQTGESCESKSDQPQQRGKISGVRDTKENRRALNVTYVLKGVCAGSRENFI